MMLSHARSWGGGGGLPTTGSAPGRPLGARPAKGGALPCAQRTAKVTAAPAPREASSRNLRLAESQSLSAALTPSPTGGGRGVGPKSPKREHKRLHRSDLSFARTPACFAGSVVMALLQPLLRNARMASLVAAPRGLRPHALPYTAKAPEFPPGLIG